MDWRRQAAEWLGLERMDATVKMLHPTTGAPAEMKIINSTRRRIDHVVEILIDNDWIILEIHHDG